MKKKGLKKVGCASFVLGVFVFVTAAMASSGKIDLSSVPVISDALSLTGTGSTENGEQTKTDGNSVAVTESETEDNRILIPDSEVIQTADSEIYAYAASATPAQSYTSITDVATDASGNIYAADATGQKLYKLNSSGSILKTYVTDDTVNAVCVNSDKVYLLKGGLAGTVVVLDTNLNKQNDIEVGHTPIDMVVNGTTGYVANRFSNTVSVINLSTNKVTKTIDVTGREPDALAIANNKLYVACHMPDESMTEEVVASNIVVISLSNNTVTKTINMVNGSDGVKGICAAKDGSRIYVTHVIGRYTYPTTQLDQGWINTNALTIINTSSDSVLTSVLLDQVELGAANPWGITTSYDGTKLIIALSGVDEAMIINISAMNNKISATQNGNGVCAFDEIPDYLPFLDGCRTRVPLSGKGARSVCAVSGKVYVGLYFDGSVDVLNMSNTTISNYRFVTQAASDDVRAGEILFSDATLCYQKWQSCLSCHPDARVDGLNWDNMNDGLGNPKSVKSMLYSHRTPPVMSTGIRASAEIAVRAGMKFIQFNSLGETAMAQIDEYLKSLQPVPSPYLNRDGSLSASAQRGKELFESVGCATCHPAPLYTDMKMHSVRTTTDTSSWENRPMDTPTLIEAWRTGPWVFDGRFNTMEDTVRYYTQGKNLSNQNITDLTNYVLSIGAEGELYGVERVLVTKDDTTSVNALSPGGKISSMTVRKQNSDAPSSVDIRIEFKSAEGNILKEMTKQIDNVAFNTAVNVDLNIDIPKDLSAGSTLTVSISDRLGNALASDYKLVY